jgi:hypothetical protein
MRSSTCEMTTNIGSVTLSELSQLELITFVKYRNSSRDIKKNLAVKKSYFTVHEVSAVKRHLSS